MRVVKHIASGMVPVAIALTAFLNARTVNALIESTVGTSWIATASAATAAPIAQKTAASADIILARNIFDSTARPKDAPAIDAVASCEGVRPLVLVAADDPDIAFAAVDVGGKKVLGRKGDEVNGMKVAYVAVDRLWLERNGTFCQSKLFGPRELPKGPTLDVPAPVTGITRLSATEMHVDRSVVEKLLDSQAELMKIRLTPEKEGDRVLGLKVGNLKPGSALAQLGVENGDRLESINNLEVTSPEKMLSAYAQLRSGQLNRITVHVNRNGKGVNLDYQVK